MDHKRGIRGLLVVYGVVGILIGTGWISNKIYEEFGAIPAAALISVVLSVPFYLLIATSEQ